MGKLGHSIKLLREEKKVPLRVVAAYLDIDQAILSKIERGKRRATRNQVLKLAEYFQVDENKLLIDWLSDKLLVEISSEEMGLKALEVAEKEMIYLSKPLIESTAIISSIKSFFKNEPRIVAAYLFGSFARGENIPESDIDIMVEFKQDKKYSMFDLIDISHLLEKKINRKIDLVEKNYLKDFAAETATKDLIKIYG